MKENVLIKGRERLLKSLIIKKIYRELSDLFWTDDSDLMVFFGVLI